MPTKSAGEKRDEERELNVFIDRERAQGRMIWYGDKEEYLRRITRLLWENFQIEQREPNYWERIQLIRNNETIEWCKKCLTDLKKKSK
jgi:hypothetical protein